MSVYEDIDAGPIVTETVAPDHGSVRRQNRVVYQGNSSLCQSLYVMLTVA